MSKLPENPFYYTQYITLEMMNQDFFAKCIDAFEKHKKEVEEYNNTQTESFNKAINAAKEVWGEKSRVISYMKKYKPFTLYAKSFDNLKKLYEDEQARLEKVRKQEIDKIAINEKKTKAVLWLQEKGKILGKDFTVDEAIYRANCFAFDEAKKEKEKMEGYIEFIGNDYCENCKGWDGKSGRCQCGNRRVSWSAGNTFSFENPSDIFPEAY